MAQAADGRGTISLSELCQKATDKIAHATNLEPRDLEQEIDQVECELVRLRDALIDRLRQRGASPVSGRRHSALEKVNIALSLILTVEYPVTAIQRSALEQAHQTLAAVLENNELAGWE